MSSAVLDELELEALGAEEVLEAAASSEPEFPQAARLSGRARLRAAMVLRRARRMMVAPCCGLSDTGYSDLSHSWIGRLECFSVSA
jgi:hypothetical protein